MAPGAGLSHSKKYQAHIVATLFTSMQVNGEPLGRNQGEMVPQSGVSGPPSC